MQTAAGDFPGQGRLAGIDFGTVRIGLATCDPSRSWVTPHDTYHRRSDERDGIFFSEWADREEIVGWVVGLPVHCDGQESQKSREARAFGAWLAERTGRPVAFCDERFTTAEARTLLRTTNLSGSKKKQQLDRIAAYLILKHFLEGAGAPPPSALDDPLPPSH